MAEEKNKGNVESIQASVTKHASKSCNIISFTIKFTH